MKQLNTTIERLQQVDVDWREFHKVYNESCCTLDSKEYLLETVPSLLPAETLQVYITSFYVFVPTAHCLVQCSMPLCRLLPVLWSDS